MYKSVESLRIIAALLVFLTHFPVSIDVPGVNLLVSGGALSGAIGVDIFFVISGFVIYLAASKYESLGLGASLSFVLQRFFRIFPLYIVVTFIYVLLSGKEYSAYAILHSILLIPTRNVEGLFLDPIVTLGWTLRYEIFFYLIVSIGIAFRSIITIPIFILGISLFYGQFNGFYFGQSIVVEFVFGYLMAFIFCRNPISIGSNYTLTMLMFFSLSLFFVAMLGKDLGYNNYGIPRMEITFGHYSFPRWIVWGIPSALLFFVCLAGEIKYSWILYPYGKYTYSLYLWSIFFVAISRMVYETTKIDGNVIFLFSCLGLAIVSYISFTSFERPIMNIFKKVTR